MTFALSLSRSLSLSLLCFVVAYTSACIPEGILFTILRQQPPRNLIGVTEGPLPPELPPPSPRHCSMASAGKEFEPDSSIHMPTGCTPAGCYLGRLIRRSGQDLREPLLGSEAKKPGRLIDESNAHQKPCILKQPRREMKEARSNERKKERKKHRERERESESEIHT